MDELESIHAEATGEGPGRRWGTEQFNGQLFVALVGQFQGFARMLHDEALDWLRGQGALATVLADQAALNRMLDKGNPHPAALGSDYARLGLRMNDRVRAASRWGDRRIHRLDRAVQLRNGIAHDDPNRLTAAAAGPPGDRAIPTLGSYRIHRRALDALAVDMDRVVASHLARLLSTQPPW